ncbi:hypothetical protein [Pengzhenrongella frigida]|uniref:Uncharacterized protein n=1 Tax=Pengzhenrongella frigida TaxID=1259133 RepID=A0A4Q5MY07_9MICO|nr:hypothetical protein [Cellulomonas sp. HLT2-17]RYV50652.1 hypothetical protein EUA98_12425 [Cellulomonas sp. HLT2-17]
MTNPDDSQAPTGTDAARAVFRTALRDMLVLVVVLAVVGIVVGYLAAGMPGVWGAVLGVALTVIFSGTTVVSMLTTAGASATTTAAVVLGSWLAKMLVLILALALLRPFDFYDKWLLGGVLMVGVIGAALIDYRAVAHGRVPNVVPGP